MYAPVNIWGFMFLIMVIKFYVSFTHESFSAQVCVCTDMCVHRYVANTAYVHAVLKPMVDAMCDPHMINQQLYDWLSYRERLSEEHKQTFTYAANYEGFIRIIDKCMEIEHLRHMRYQSKRRALNLLPRVWFLPEETYFFRDALKKLEERCFFHFLPGGKWKKPEETKKHHNKALEEILG